MKNSNNKRVVKGKKVKLTSIPVITRRLFRLASEKCRENAGFQCEVCGMKNGDKSKTTGKPQKVEAHHIMSRSNKDSLLKFDLRNLICLCSGHHKFNKFSAHSHGIWFAEWLRLNQPEKYKWVLENSDNTADLRDRSVLEWIEKCLKSNKPLDINIKEESKVPEQLEFNFY